MSVTVRVPTQLRSLTGGAAEVEAAGGTLAEVIADLEDRHPGFAERLTQDGKLRRFVNVYIGDDDVRFLDGVDTQVAPGATVAIIPAVAGG